MQPLARGTDISQTITYISLMLELSDLSAALLTQQRTFAAIPALDTYVAF